MILNNEHYKLILVFMYALFATYVCTDYFIRKFGSRGYTVPDMYKKGKPKIPIMGGLAIVCGIMVSIILAQILVYEFSTANLMIFFFLVYVHGIFGIVDDLVNIGRKIKILAPFFMALPIALLVQNTVVSTPWFSQDLGVVFTFFVAPLYVMVVSNLVNMHEGYNGLAAGLSTIILVFTAIKVVISGRDIGLLFYLLPILGSLIAFMWFHFYPSRVFLGNSGTLMLGAAIGGLMIVYHLEIFGIIILIPHIINFLMWVYWVLNMKKYPHVKFAKLRYDGTIDPPNGLTVKYLVAKIFRVNELQAVLVLYGITSVFGVLALVFG